MKNKKKQIVAKLAGVTILSTSALGVVAPIAGVIPGVGVTSSAQEVGNVELTGTMKLSGNEKTNWAHRDTWQIDAKVKQRVKEGDKITFKAKGIEVDSLNNSEIKLKDGTVIGKIVLSGDGYYHEVNGKKYYYFDRGDKWNNENSSLYNTDLTKLNDGQKNLKPDTQLITDFEIIFNKKAEEFNTLDFSIGLTNKRSTTILSSKDQDVIYSIESGGKTIVKNSFKLKGITLVKQVPFGLYNDSSLNGVTNTEAGLGTGNLLYAVDPSPTEPLRKGDRVVFESKSDSNFKFDSENNRIKVGSVVTLGHGRALSEGDMIANEHGAYITKLNHLEAKIVESTPDKVVFEIMNDNYTENVNIGLPIKVTSFEGYNKEQNKITGLKYYIRTETNDPKTTKSVSGPATIQVDGVSVGASGVKIQYKTTQWIDEATKKAIKNSKIAETVEPAGTIDGYTFVRTDTDSKTGNVTHIFKKNQVKKLEKDDVKVTTKWIDESTKESLTKVVIGDKPVEPGTIKGYTFVRTEHPTESEYIHVFKKNEEPKKVVTRFVDENGNLIKEKPATVEKEEIPDYNFVRTEKDKDGNTTHHYNSVKTIYKDEDGNVIKTDKGKKTADKITGYTFVKTEVDKDGNTVHTYHKIVTKFVNNKDGKEIVLKTVDGEQPKEDLDGYDFEKTEKDEKTGDVIHLYKAKAKIADKKEAVKTGASAGKIILPILGLAGLGGLVSFAAKRKSKK